MQDGRGEVVDWVDGEDKNADWIMMKITSPLKIMICTVEEGWIGVSFSEDREGSVIRLMDQLSKGETGLETTQ